MMIIEDWLQKEWPIKQFEGSIKIELSQGKYIATIKYFVFDKRGRGNPLTDWAANDTPDKAFSELWKKAILTIKELKESNELPIQLTDWAYRFLEDRP